MKRILALTYITLIFLCVLALPGCKHSTPSHTSSGSGPDISGAGGGLP